MRRALVLLPRLVLFALLVPLVLGTSRSAGADAPLLVGTVGPGFTIELADAGGKQVHVLAAGTYGLVVHDLSDIHNFALGDKTTNTRILTGSVEGVGDEHYTLHLEPGVYVYACSAHPDTMHGTFTVLAAPGSTLRAKVTNRGTSLSARRVFAGRYRLVVIDRSRKRNFHLVGHGVNRRTTKNFVGKATWHVRLKAGSYRYGSDPRLAGRLAARRN